MTPAKKIMMMSSLRNLANNGVNYANWTVDAGSSKGATGIHLVQTGANELATLNTALQGSTVYTLVYRVTESTLTDQLKVYSELTGSIFTVSKALGVRKIKITTQVTITTNKLHFFIGGGTDGEYINFTDVMLVEGDQTNNPQIDVYIPYLA